MPINDSDQQSLLDATFRRLVDQLEALDLPSSATDDIQSEIDRIGLLIGQLPTASASTFSLLDQVDWVIGTLAPLTLDVYLEFDPNQDLIVTGDIYEVRRKLYDAITSVAASQSQTNLILSSSTDATVTVKYPDGQQKPLLTLPNVARRARKPAFRDLTALVICEASQARETLLRRLESLGVHCITQLIAEHIDVCIISDEHSSAFLATRPMLHERTVLVLNSKTTRSSDRWIQLGGPVTQRRLQDALAPIAQSLNTQTAYGVLIVDDNPSNTRLLQAQLAELGQAVDVADSGESAIDAVQQKEYKLVFMDLQMPGISGANATHELRQLGVSCPVYGLTAHVSVAERKDCLASGMDEVLIKPIRLERLEAILQQSLSDSPGPLAATRRRNQPVFNRTLALAVVNNRVDVANEMLMLLAETLPEDLAAINSSANDLTILKQRCHALLGALRFTGAPRLLDAVEQLEQAINTGDAVRIDSLRHRTNSEATAFLSWYQEEYREAYADKAGVFESLPDDKNSTG